jgi:hypothetical protein
MSTKYISASFQGRSFIMIMSGTYVQYVCQGRSFIMIMSGTYVQYVCQDRSFIMIMSRTYVQYITLCLQHLATRSLLFFYLPVIVGCITSSGE